MHGRKIMMSAAALAVAALVTAGSCDTEPPAAPIPTSPAPNGDITPGGRCNVPGHKTVIDGKTYECKEPRPYQWRPVS